MQTRKQKKLQRDGFVKEVLKTEYSNTTPILDAILQCASIDPYEFYLHLAQFISGQINIICLYGTSDFRIRKLIGERILGTMIKNDNDHEDSIHYCNVHIETCAFTHPSELDNDRYPRFIMDERIQSKQQNTINISQDIWNNVNQFLFVELARNLYEPLIPPPPPSSATKKSIWHQYFSRHRNVYKMSEIDLIESSDHIRSRAFSIYKTYLYNTFIHGTSSSSSLDHPLFSIGDLVRMVLSYLL